MGRRKKNSRRPVPVVWEEVADTMARDMTRAFFIAPEAERMSAMSEKDEKDDVLLVVAVRTNQHDIGRRLQMILNASAPEHPVADAQVIAREPTADDCDRLGVLFGYDVLGALGWHRTADAA